MYAGRYISVYQVVHKSRVEKRPRLHAWPARISLIQIGHLANNNKKSAQAAMMVNCIFGAVAVVSVLLTVTSRYCLEKYSLSGAGSSNKSNNMDQNSSHKYN